MGTRLQRIREAIHSAVVSGQMTWSTDFLAAQDPRFAPVWKVTNQIPGWFVEVNAVAQFLILAELRPTNIVEIGSYLGRSTVFFAKTLEALDVDGTVTAIDPHTGDRQHLENLGADELPSYEMFRTHLATTRMTDRVRPIVAPSHDVAAKWNEPIDFLFIDGWHSYDAVIEDGHDWMPHLADRGVVVIDDATRYPDVRRAVDDLASDGTIVLYGDAYGQALAGRRPEMPQSVRMVLDAERPLTRHLPGHRSVR
jgi:predicted O-methyltransferase YrrM